MVVRHDRRGECLARMSPLAPLSQLSRAFVSPWLVCLARAAASPVEQQVTGDIVVALAVNQSHPALMANHLAEPHDFVLSALHVSGEALLFLR